MSATPEMLLRYATRLEAALTAELDQRAPLVAERLLAAMRYSLLAGGKRVRPALLLTCYAACGGRDPAQAMPAAMAIEAMHTYSLIHDDLPCMDDDDLRRGQPTCHKQFDEATAVLAGDALQSLAYEWLAASPLDSELCCQLLHSLTIAAGCRGMVGGQMLDMAAEQDGEGIDILAVERIHLHKTGALLRWSCEAGARIAGADDAQLAACSRYGKAVGLLFQIADDILDVTASSAALGKSAGKDAAQNKATYVSLLGLPRARELADEMHAMAVEACAPLQRAADDHAEPHVKQSAADLLQLADYIKEREK